MMNPAGSMWGTMPSPARCQRRGPIGGRFAGRGVGRHGERGVVDATGPPAALSDAGVVLLAIVEHLVHVRLRPRLDAAHDVVERGSEVS